MPGLSWGLALPGTEVPVKGVQVIDYEDPRLPGDFAGPGVRRHAA